MAIKIQGTDVITDDRVITNINSIDNIIREPVNISPANNTTNVGESEIGEDTSRFNFQLTISTFYALLEPVDTVQFQISDTSDFSNIVLDEEIAASEGSQNTLTITDISQVLTEGTTYYWRAKYFDTVGNESVFTDPTEFTTAPQFINIETPTIISPSEGDLLDADSVITVTASSFNVTNGSTTHRFTDWQVATDSDFSNIIFESLDDTSNLTSIDIPQATLNFNDTHFIRVRYNGTSSYSSTRSFLTAEQFGLLDLAAGSFTTYDSTNDELNVSFDGQDNWDEELIAVDNSNGSPFEVIINASSITTSYDESQVSGTNTISGHSTRIDIRIDGSNIYSENVYDAGFSSPDPLNGTETNRGINHSETSPNPGRISVHFNGNTTEDSRSSGTSYADYDANFDVFEINPI